MKTKVPTVFFLYINFGFHTWWVFLKKKFKKFNAWCSNGRSWNTVEEFKYFVMTLITIFCFYIIFYWLLHMTSSVVVTCANWVAGGKFKFKFISIFFLDYYLTICSRLAYTKSFKNMSCFEFCFAYFCFHGRKFRNRLFCLSVILIYNYFCVFFLFLQKKKRFE